MKPSSSITPARGLAPSDLSHPASKLFFEYHADALNVLLQAMKQRELRRRIDRTVVMFIGFTWAIPGAEGGAL